MPERSIYWAIFWTTGMNTVCSPKGFTRFFGKLAELSDNGIDIHWFIGNHDIWIFDYLPHELGITIHDGTLITEIGENVSSSRMETMSEKDP